MEKAIRGWKDELMRAHRRMGDLFARTEARERSLAYLIWSDPVNFCETVGLFLSLSLHWSWVCDIKVGIMRPGDPPSNPRIVR